MCLDQCILKCEGAEPRLTPEVIQVLDPFILQILNLNNLYFIHFEKVSVFQFFVFISLVMLKVVIRLNVTYTHTHTHVAFPVLIWSVHWCKTYSCSSLLWFQHVESAHQRMCVLHLTGPQPWTSCPYCALVEDNQHSHSYKPCLEFFLVYVSVE